MQNGNHLNQAVQDNNPKKSRFTLREKVAFTPRFGQITPFMSMSVLPDDDIRMNTILDLRTFTLKSPLLKNLTMNKQYFQIPMECILPFNWKTKIFPNPNIGDDIPVDAYCYGNYDFIRTQLINVEFPEPQALAGFEPARRNELLLMLFYWLNSVDIIFSSNSLANTLGYGIPFVDFTYPTPQDSLFTDASSLLGIYSLDGELIEEFPLNSLNYHLLRSLITDNYCKIYIDNKPLLEVPYVTENYYDFYPVYKSVRAKLSALPSNCMKFDASKLFAYQLLCAHFHTNDKVDFIYTAELWRENYLSLLGGSEFLESFAYNGRSVPYDWLSYHHISNNFGTLTTSFDSISKYNLISEIFGYRRSLKYIDYFTGARPRPLAIGNTDVNITASNTVSVIDITRSIQVQRFLNQVNRSGRKFSNYIEGLFGTSPRQDMHDPILLGSTNEVVYGSEVENTGEAQFTMDNSITTNLRCNSNRFEFDVQVNEPSIIIGVITFDIERYYTDASKRENYYKDRFDMFNPYLQFIGDQPLYLRELVRDSSVEKDGALVPFGYETRYLEYKMGFARALGGFRTNALPSWLFTSQDFTKHISPEYIRSNPSELDRFYLNGTGDSTDNYFHFIILAENEISATRPMVINPNILA